jgi:DNA-directed RNA polymerase sigma subunit (sigma70/sigma32)
MKKQDLMDCSRECLEQNKSCDMKGCRYFINYSEEHNCCMISIYKNGPLSLREVAEREGLSFARIKQIQDKALVKLKKKIPEGEELLSSSGQLDYLF